MYKILQVDFAFNGPFGKATTDALNELALSIIEEPGFIWKIWTENASLKEAGGIYLFESEATARAYLERNSARLKGLGVAEVRGRIYDINVELSKITKAPDSIAKLSIFPYSSAAKTSLLTGDEPGTIRMQNRHAGRIDRDNPQ